MKFNKILNDVTTYEAGKPIELVVRDYGIDSKNIIKLASNENPYGTSLMVKNLIKNSVDKMFLYPDDSYYELKDALSGRFDVKSDNIIIGAGSDQIIEFVIKAKCTQESNILIAGTTFAMYEIYAKQIGANIIKTEDSQHNLKQFKEIYQQNNIDIVFLCLPNNPLGEALDSKEVYNFLDSIDKNTLVVVDGAYQEYATYKDKSKQIKPSELISKYANSIYLGTFSKAYGLGGMRVGYGISNSSIINILSKLRSPFNITTLSLLSAIEALKDEEFISTSIANNFVEMKRYEEYFTNIGFDFIDSYTNFITILLPDKFSSKAIVNRLLSQGIIIRDLSSYGLNAFRITIGTVNQNSEFFNHFSKLGLK